MSSLHLKLRPNLCWILVCILGVIRIYAQAPMSSSSALHLRKPVDYPLRLSGTFGELRSGHFHTGIDIKSANGRSGDSILAVADGIVSRIKVGAGGYGNALYIDHPGGLTSVYAHLLAFTPTIDSLVERYQYERENFEIDISKGLPELRVKQGQRIATLGSTGHSMGPHLHFELRNTGSETPINPLLHYELRDKIAPYINQVVIYHLDHNHQSYRRTDLSRKSSWMLDDTIVIDAWRMGVGVNAIDPHNNNTNKNGLYEVVLQVDGDTIYHSRLDSIAWDDGDYYPVFVDHAEAIKTRRKIQKCFDVNEGLRVVQGHSGARGVIPLYRHQAQFISLTVADFYGNRSEATFWARRADAITPADYEPYHYSIEPDKPYRIDTGGLMVYFPAESLYEKLRCRIVITPDEMPSMGYSSMFHLHDPSVPLKQALHISLRTRNIAPGKRDQAVIVVDANTKKRSAIKSRWQGHFLSGQLQEFGVLSVEVDTVPPIIFLLRRSNHVGKVHLRFRIEDDLTRSGELEFRGELDGQWILGHHELKSSSISYEIDKSDWDIGEHLFRLAVTDIANNTKDYVIRFLN
ncbi:MAG: M23 family metallopeptidase [Saprospiraceae bacterium]|nr:M23 family metallopeptidase [Saprospiraceae bacterium]